VSRQTIDLIRAFPSTVELQAREAVRILSGRTIGPSDLFGVLVCGEPVEIPYRIANVIPDSADCLALPPVGRLILDCLYTRHHDGFERQRRLERVIGSAEPWVVPFVVQLIGEYVIEILDAIRENLGGLAASDPRRRPYAEFVAGNPDYVDLTAQRVTSYWDRYYRWRFPRTQERLSPNVSDYPGFQLIGLLRSLTVVPASTSGSARGFTAAPHRRNRPHLKR
jgi:hypothetical protein